MSYLRNFKGYTVVDEIMWNTFDESQTLCIDH